MLAVRGSAAGVALAERHLLLLPRAEPAEVVVGLTRARHPEVAQVDEHAWRVGRWTTLTGPLLLDDDAAAAARVPAPWSAAWALEAPVERDGPPLPGTTDRDGMGRAFPRGLPVRAEGRAVALAVALARRLSGALRVAGSGELLRPDPRAWLDRVVHAPYWLAPEQALDVAAAVAPGIELATAGEAWSGPSREAGAALGAPGAGGELTDAVREQIHRAAEAADARAAAAPDALDSYALALDCGPAGLVQVGVEGAVTPPPVLAGTSWATQAVTYRVAWWPVDPADAEVEHPSAAHRAHRAQVRGVVVALAGALAAATAGVEVDADGFPVSAG